MLEHLVSALLRLYPADFRERFGPQIHADISQPGTRRLPALFDLLRTGLVHRAHTPAPYVWTAAAILAGLTVSLSGMLTLRNAYRLLRPRAHTDAQMYALLFLAVFIVVAGVLTLSIHWLHTYRRITAPCSKSKT